MPFRVGRTWCACLVVAGASILKGGGVPCNGQSPSDVRWVYAQAEHTATATVQPWLAHTLATFGGANGSCHHSHEPRMPRATNFTFTFTASPFRRVLSDAAHRWIIPGGRGGIPAEINQTRIVEQFRTWVKKPKGGLMVKRHHMIPRAIWVQSYQLDYFPKPRFIGRVNNLTRSFQELLHVLGYPRGIFKGFNALHCSATCSKRLPSQGYFSVNYTDLNAVRTEASSKDRAGFASGPDATVSKMINTSIWNPASVDWYDDETAARVVKLFERDFREFGFSTDPSHMWHE
jgi:hypothetical protein